MSLSGDVHEICNVRTERIRDTAFGTWAKPWRGWGRRIATDTLCHSSQTDSTYVSFFQEIGYERRLGDTLQRLEGSLCLDFPTVPGEVVSLSGPYKKIYFSTSREHWPCDVNLDCCMRPYQ